jgi:hypothetical protein
LDVKIVSWKIKRQRNACRFSFFEHKFCPPIYTKRYIHTKRGEKMPDDKKKTYYISMGHGEISQVKTASPWDFQIEATDEEIIRLREYFDQMYSSDVQAFFRAHVPYIQYHYDRSNDGYDEMMQKAYALIYKLGDEEAKQHIRSLGFVQE